MPNATPNDTPKRPLPNLAVRFLTAGVGIPIILWMLYSAPPYVFSVFALFAALVGGHEIGTMTMKDHTFEKLWISVATVCVTASLLFPPAMSWVPTLPTIATVLFGLVVFGAFTVLTLPNPIETASARMAWLIAGPLYVGVTLAALARLHHYEHGGTWVLLSMALAWGSDTGGYFAGKAFGRHKLYAQISPKKTVEGAIGGLLTVVIAAVIIAHLGLPTVPLLHTIILALIAGAAGQAGDLCISVIKRSTGVKDSGFIIPGHGGLLDRIDALMFTAVTTQLYLMWFSSQSPIFVLD